MLFQTSIMFVPYIKLARYGRLITYVLCNMFYTTENCVTNLAVLSMLTYTKCKAIVGYTGKKCCLDIVLLSRFFVLASPVEPESANSLKVKAGPIGLF